MPTNLDDLLKEAPALSLELADTKAAAPAASETAEASAAAASRSCLTPALSLPKT